MILYRTPWFDVVRRRGRFVIEEINNRAGAVIVPKVENRFMLIEVERPAISRSSLEFPRGFADKGETAEECAARELHEETGASIKIGGLELIGKVAPNTGLLDSIVNVYKVVSFDSLSSPVDGEASAVHLLSYDELLAAIRKGQIIDGFTLSAVTLLASQEL